MLNQACGCLQAESKAIRVSDCSKQSLQHVERRLQTGCDSSMECTTHLIVNINMDIPYSVVVAGCNMLPLSICPPCLLSLHTNTQCMYAL